MLLTALIMRRGTSTVFLSLALGLGGLSWAGFGVNKSLSSIIITDDKTDANDKTVERYLLFLGLGNPCWSVLELIQCHHRCIVAIMDSNYSKSFVFLGSGLDLGWRNHFQSVMAIACHCIRVIQILPNSETNLYKENNHHIPGEPLGHSTTVRTNPDGNKQHGEHFWIRWVNLFCLNTESHFHIVQGCFDKNLIMAMPNVEGWNTSRYNESNTYRDSDQGQG